MKKLTTILAILYVVAFLIPVNAQQATPKWDLSKCLEYGMKNHPLLKIAESNIEVSKASVEQGRSSWDPKLGFRANWAHRKSEFTNAAKRTPGADTTTDSTSESLSVSKNLFDSGKTSAAINTAKENLKSSKQDLFDTRINVATQIKIAFFQALQAKELLTVQQETLDGYLKHLEKVEGYVEVGTRPPYDITRAQVDVANSKVKLISQKSQLKQRLALLAKAIGYEGNIEIADFNMEELPRVLFSDKEVLLKEALDRPEVQSAKHSIKASKFSVREARTGLKPSVSASADYNWAGTISPLNRSWNAGVSLNWSVFDGKLTKSRINSAKSRLSSAEANLANLKLNINTELENAITGLEDALERFEATKVLVQQASESKYLAEGRYDSGLGSPIEITDARVEFASARGNYVVAYFDSLIAMTSLDRVRGRMPFEYATINETQENKEQTTKSVKEVSK